MTTEVDNVDETSPLMVRRSLSAPHHGTGYKLGMIEEDAVKDNFEDDVIDEQEDIMRRRYYHRFHRTKRSSSIASIATMVSFFPQYSKVFIAPGTA